MEVEQKDPEEGPLKQRARKDQKPAERVQMRAAEAMPGMIMPNTNNTKESMSPRSNAVKPL